MNNLGIVSWKRSRTARSTLCSPCCGSIPSTLGWTYWIVGSCSSLPSKTRGSGVFRTGGSVSWLPLCEHRLLLERFSVVDLVFWSLMLPLRVSSNSTQRVSPGGCSRFEPDVHDANSTWVRPCAVTLEIDTLYIVQFFSRLHENSFLDAYRR